jgi:hypothetical protein
MPDSVEVGMKYIAESFWRRRLTAAPVVLRGRTAVAVKGVAAFQAIMIGEGSGREGWREEDGDDNVAPHASRVDEQAHAKACSEVDILWLVRGFRGGRLGWLTEAYRPKLLVLDASLPRWQSAELREEAKKIGWRVYDVAEQGAMRIRL